MDKDAKLNGFMDGFLSGPEPKLDEELFALEQAYAKQFGHGVPREMLPDSVTPDALKAAIRACIDAGRDDLAAALGVKWNGDHRY